MYSHETRLIEAGYGHIAGCDEAGRGPLAGPLVVAAVVLDPKDTIADLFDSKQLSEKKREQLFTQIKMRALDYAIEIIDVPTLDALNVYQASKRGMMDAVGKLRQVDYVLTDAMPLKLAGIESLSLIKGDTISASIAAASILAKVTRDRLMIEAAERYPEYRFERHKGYPTKAHMEALKTHGVCPIHRRSFAPVKHILNHQTKLAL